MLQDDVFGLRRRLKIDLENTRREAVCRSREADRKNIGNCRILGIPPELERQRKRRER